MTTLPRNAAARVLTFALAGLLVLTGCASGGGAPPAPTTETLEFTDEYRIGVGDSVRVNVWRNADLTVTVPVRPDGKISVPLAGDVQVGGRTPEQVAGVVTERLTKFIRDPNVTVIVTEMGSDAFRSRVRVTGAVENPVSIPFRQGMTVLDMVLEAGGITEFAVPGKATLYRRNGEHMKIKLDRILRKGDMSTNFPLVPGDVITVPERSF